MTPETRAHRTWWTYTEIDAEMRTHPLRTTEIPLSGVRVSMPLPTKRVGSPGYLFFFSQTTPARPGTPSQQYPPAAWWVLDGRSKHLLLFARTSVLTFGESQAWTVETLPDLALTMDQYQATRATVEGYLDDLAVAFFDGQEGPEGIKAATRDLLPQIIHAPILPQYRAAAPDFFSWLGVPAPPR